MLEMRHPLDRKVDKICLNCEIEFRVHRYRKDEAKYCSHKCASEHKRGRPSWNKGLKSSVSTCEKIRQNNLRLWQDPKYRAKQIQARKDNWKRPEYRKRLLSKEARQARLKGLFVRPTSFERKIISLIKIHKLPFKYVGDGEILISKFNPDFINTNGQKLLIETYCSRLHPPNYVKQRYAIFRKYGFRTLFLSEDEIEAPNWESICLNKIQGVLNV